VRRSLRTASLFTKARRRFQGGSYGGISTTGVFLFLDSILQYRYFSTQHRNHHFLVHKQYHFVITRVPCIAKGKIVQGCLGECLEGKDSMLETEQGHKLSVLVGEVSHTSTP
jgi:hypothetical protein